MPTSTLWGLVWGFRFHMSDPITFPAEDKTTVELHEGRIRITQDTPNELAIIDLSPERAIAVCKAIGEIIREVERINEARASRDFSEAIRKAMED